MLVSIVAYSFIWGWKFAAGFVVLLFVHEMGHVIQLRREGIEASAPMFIPFLGAAVMAKSLGDNATGRGPRRPRRARSSARSARLALLPLADATGNDIWQALAFTGFFLNLFNLLPVVPLDGGRAMAAMSPWMWCVGLFGIVVLAFAFPNPIILLIALLAGSSCTGAGSSAQGRRGGDRLLQGQPAHRLGDRRRLPRPDRRLRRSGWSSRTSSAASRPSSWQADSVSAV